MLLHRASCADAARGRPQRGTHAQLLAAPLPAAPGVVSYRTLAAQLEATAAATGDAP